MSRLAKCVNNICVKINHYMSNAQIRALILALLVCVASAIWGFYWQEIDWLHSLVREMVAEPLYICLATTVSMCIIATIVMSVIFKWKCTSYIWCVFLPILILFWGYAGLENFEWSSLSGVLGVFIICVCIIIPIVSKPKEKILSYPDLLGRTLLYTDAISGIRRLVNSKKNEGVSVAVYGEWGSGKTHFINHLVSKLVNGEYENDETINNERDKYIACSVDVWKIQDKKRIPHDISLALASALDGRFVGNIYKWGTVMSKIMEVLPYSHATLVNSILQILITGASNITTVPTVLESRLKRKKKYVILVLDNIDRCDKSIVQALFPYIEKLKYVPGVIIICGVTIEKLAEIFSEPTQDASYVNEITRKLIDLPICLPKVHPERITNYLQTKVKESKLKCPNLMRWIENQNLPFETPRQLNQVVHHLAALDHCYLWRHEGEDLRSKNISNCMGYHTRVQTVFYFECLRLFCPDIIPVIAAHKQPENDFFSKLRVPDTDWQEGANDAIDIKKEAYSFPEDMSDKQKELYSKNKLFRVVMRKLKQSSDDDLRYAVEQRYLVLDQLTQEEKDEVIRVYLSSNNNHPIDTIRLLHGNRVIETDIPMLYASVFEYSMEYAQSSCNADFICSCLEKDLQRKDDYYNALFKYKFLLQFLYARMIATSNLDKLDSLLDDLFGRCDLRTLNSILEAIWIYDNMGERYMYNTELYDIYPPLFREIIKNQNMDKLDLICRHYGYKMCEDILSPRPKWRNWTACTFDVTCKNQSSVEEGVDNYLSGRAWAEKLNNPEECLHKLLASVYDEKTIVRDTGEPLCHEHFIVLWKKLFDAFISYVKKERIDIKQFSSFSNISSILDKIVKFNRDKILGQENPFHQDDLKYIMYESRKRGIGILIDSLMRIKDDE